MLPRLLFQVLAGGEIADHTPVTYVSCTVVQVDREISSGNSGRPGALLSTRWGAGLPKSLSLRQPFGQGDPAAYGQQPQE